MHFFELERMLCYSAITVVKISKEKSHSVTKSQLFKE